MSAARSQQNPAPVAPGGGVGAVRGALADAQVRSRLVRVARGVVPQDAEDAAHDGVVRALTAAGRFRQQSSVTTWLHRIVVNEALMRRRRGRTAERVAEKVRRDDLLWAAGAANTVGPAEALEQRENVQTLHQAVASLAPRYRAIAEGYLLASRSPRDAAAALGVTEGALRTGASRARQMLLRALAA